MRLLVILAMLFTGCGSESQKLSFSNHLSHKKQYDTSDFEDYVKTFEADAEDRGQIFIIDDLTISWKSLNNLTPETTTYILGVCTLSTDATPHIDIDPDLWNKESDEEHQLLLSHELGHCILHRQHMADHLSIMRAMMISDEEYNSEPTTLLDELYNQQYYDTFNLVDDVDRKWVN